MLGLDRLLSPLLYQMSSAVYTDVTDAPAGCLNRPCGAATSLAITRLRVLLRPQRRLKPLPRCDGSGMLFIGVVPGEG